MADRPFQTVLRFITDQDRERPAEWTIRGTIRQPFRVRPALTFTGGDALIEGVPPSSKRLRIPLQDGVVSVAVEPVVDRGTVKLVSVGSREAVVEVTPPAALAPGHFRYAIPLVPQLADGSELPAVPLIVSGSVTRDLIVMPRAPRFEPGRIGSEVMSRFQIQSRRGRRFNIAATKANGDVAVALVDKDALGGPLYEVRRRIERPGPYEDVVGVDVGIDGKETVSLVVTLRGLGLPERDTDAR
ncbi:MAG: hypothetical protein WBC44_02300 [Planctomycetaceae bacterium]